MTTNVETYFIDGCGRCAFGGTPQCKVHNWEIELKYLRNTILSCGLTEESKWGMPTYTFQKNNILMLAAFKEYCAISFFKGALLSDTEGILEKQGENTQLARIIKFVDLSKIFAFESVIKAYIYEATEVEIAGLKIEGKKTAEPLPEELLAKFEEYPNLKIAFEKLAPSKQRGYLIHFSGTSFSKTKETRIEKCIPKILIGKGFNDK
jgi:uncharacterized protein YdeI (YjbR/CyaY-like superfamily)